MFWKSKHISLPVGLKERDFIVGLVFCGRGGHRVTCGGQPFSMARLPKPGSSYILSPKHDNRFGDV